MTPCPQLRSVGGRGVAGSAGWKVPQWWWYKIYGSRPLDHSPLTSLPLPCIPTLTTSSSLSPTRTSPSYNPARSMEDAGNPRLKKVAPNNEEESTRERECKWKVRAACLLVTLPLLIHHSIPLLSGTVPTEATGLPRLRGQFWLANANRPERVSGRCRLQHGRTQLWLPHRWACARTSSWFQRGRGLKWKRRCS